MKVQVGNLVDIINFDPAESCSSFEFRAAVAKINANLEPNVIDERDLYRAVLDAEAFMNHRSLPLDCRAGFKMTIRPEELGTASEKRSAKNVEYRFERTSDGWFFVDGKSIRVQRGEKAKKQYFATREQIKIIRKLAVAHVVAGLRIAK